MNQKGKESIDNLISKYGDEMINSIEKYGVLVEGQFNLSGYIFRRCFPYLQEKLVEKGLYHYVCEGNEFDNDILIGNFHLNSPVGDGNHFYFAYHRDISRDVGLQRAIKIYQSEVLDR